MQQNLNQNLSSIAPQTPKTLKSNDMDRLGKFLLFAICISLAACDAGYQLENGQWAFVTVDEGHGRRVNPLAVDSASFEILPNREYAKDKDQVFYRGHAIEGVDAKSYRLIPRSFYALDDHAVFLIHQKVIGADPETFTVLRFPYAKDKNYFYNGILPIAPNTGQRAKVTRSSMGYSVTSLSAFIADDSSFHYLDTLDIDQVTHGRGSIKIGEEVFVDYKKVEGD